MLKYTLVPTALFNEEKASEYLSSITFIEKTDTVKSIELPSFKAVLVYSGDEGSAIALSELITAVSSLNAHNKVLARLDSDSVDIIIAAGDRLLLCNSYPATDKTTAQYFILAALKQFQINPEVTTLHLCGETDETVQEDLMHYFSSVDYLQ